MNIFMKRIDSVRLMFFLLCSTVAVGGCEVVSPPSITMGGSPERPITVKVGQEVSLGQVFWARACESFLDRVIGVTVLDGDTSNLEFSLKRDILVSSPNCPGRQLPGAMVFVQAKEPVQTPRPVTIRYIVRYDTLDGGTAQSSHTRYLLIVPSEGKGIKRVE